MVLLINYHMMFASMRLLHVWPMYVTLPNINELWHPGFQAAGFFCNQQGWRCCFLSSSLTQILFPGEDTPGFDAKIKSYGSSKARWILPSIYGKPWLTKFTNGCVFLLMLYACLTTWTPDAGLMMQLFKYALILSKVWSVIKLVVHAHFTPNTWADLIVYCESLPSADFDSNQAVVDCHFMSALTEKQDGYPKHDTQVVDRRASGHRWSRSSQRSWHIVSFLKKHKISLPGFLGFGDGRSCQNWAANSVQIHRNKNEL